jgi:hypothetical protein
MLSNPERQQQEDNFNNFRPTLDATEATTPAGPDGEIVSWAVLQAIPGRRFVEACDENDDIWTVPSDACRGF